MVQDCPYTGASEADADGVGTERVAHGQEEAVGAERGLPQGLELWVLRSV